jgi:hypothetical protein
MAFTESEVAEHTRILDVFVQQTRPPAHIQDKLDYSYDLDVSKQAVELVEIRPSIQNPKKKSRLAFARARYIRSANEWRIYWMRSDLKWHSYEPMSSAPKLLVFLAVVREDEYGCFYG